MAAFYVPHENFEQVFKLPHATSSAETEPLTILAALRYISHSLPRAWTAFTGSKTALEAMLYYSAKVISGVLSIKPASSI